MRNFLCNKKRAIFRLLFRFLFWLLFSHYRMAATIAKASMAIKTITPPATIANVFFFIFSPLSLGYISLFWYLFWFLGTDIPDNVPQVFWNRSRCSLIHDFCCIQFYTPAMPYCIFRLHVFCRICIRHLTSPHTVDYFERLQRNLLQLEHFP